MVEFLNDIFGWAEGDNWLGLVIPALGILVLIICGVLYLIAMIGDKFGKK